MARWEPGKKGKKAVDMARYIKALDDNPDLDFIDVHDKRVDTPPRELLKRATIALGNREDIEVYIDVEDEKYTLRFAKVETEE
jgi:hypothetical protein